MPVFKLGPFLTLQGDGLAVAADRRSVRSFTAVEFKDADRLRLPADATFAGPAPEASPVSVLRLPNGTSFGPNDLTAELPDNTQAVLWFHCPIPLSPWSAGVWLEIAIIRRGGEYRIRYDQSVLRYFNGRKRPRDFAQASIITAPKVAGIGAWISAWQAAPAALLLSTKFPGDRADEDWKAILDDAVERCVLFSSAPGNRAAVLVGFPGQPQKHTPSFALSFVSGPTGSRLSARFSADPFGSDAAPVNSRALRLEELDDFRPLAFWWNRAIALEAASVLSDAGEPMWLVDWKGIPFSPPGADPLELSLRALWQGFTRHYGIGLRAVQARNSLSFLPTDVASASPTSWLLRFTMRRDPAGGWRTELREIGAAQEAPVRFALGLAPRTDGSIPLLTARVNTTQFGSLGVADAAGAEPALLALTLGPSGEEIGEILIGGVIVRAGALTGSPAALSSIELRLNDSPINLGQPPLGVRIRLQATAGLPLPGNEDPERGFETALDGLERERPIVIDLLGETNGSTALRVSEDTSATKSRNLLVTLRKTSGKSLRADVVVLDPAPFLVSRVQADASFIEDENPIVAVYSDDGESQAAWEFHSNTGRMALILPPQAIGEEMIKSKLSITVDGKAVAVPFDDRPFDFRLSPPARLGLDRTDIDTARSAPPWTLRRLLAQRLGAVGLRLETARFELLYGLTTRVEKNGGLRIAEQDAFVGYVPFPTDLRDRLARGNWEPQNADQKAYAEHVAAWIRALLYRPAQLPVFRDWTARERLLLTDGVGFRVRQSRQAAHPLRIEALHPNASLSDDVDARRLPLRGGLDYGFESENIYNKITGTAEGGSIAGVVFGGLGGTGSQEAVFDNGRTRVITDTTQGRLNGMTIIRTGRISMLWNHARHVIVYERSTRTMPRYRETDPKQVANRDEQPSAFEGLAALRKVKEYVEVTQPRRAYPDFPTADPVGGPLVGSFFETAVIPVQASWGHDVEGGWVMPLTGPVVEEKAQYYPTPRIFLELARAASKGGGYVSQLIDSPERIQFFTSTRAEDHGETDAWPAWPNIDFPLTQRPSAPSDLNFLPAFNGASRQPDAQDYDYGQRRFTIDLRPAEEAVNLMHGRPSDGLEARVRNVSLMRGRPAPAQLASAVDAKIGRVFAQSEAVLADTLRELDNHLQRLLQTDTEILIAQIDGLRTQARSAIDSARLAANRLHEGMQDGRQAFEAHAATWPRTQADWNTRAVIEGRRALKTWWTEQSQRALYAALQRYRDLAATPVQAKAEVKNRVHGTVEAFCRQVKDRIDTIGYVPEAAHQKLRLALDRMQADLTLHVERERNHWLQLLTALQARFRSEGPRALEAELRTALLGSRALLVRVGVDAPRICKDALGELFADLPGVSGAIHQIAEAIESVTNAMESWLDDVIEEIPPFDLLEPDWALLRAELSTVVVEIPDAFAVVQTKLVDELAAALEPWRAARQVVVGDLETVCNRLHNELDLAVDGGIDSLEGALAQLDLDDALSRGLDRVGKVATDQITLLLDNNEWIRNLGTDVAAVVTAVDRLATDLSALAQQLEQGTIRTVEELRAALQATVLRPAMATLRTVGEAIEQAVVREIGGAIAGVERGALELARALAEGPITDALRCSRDWVGYYYHVAQDALDVTRAAALFNDLGQNVLNSLSAQVPFDRVRDRILAQLAHLDLNKLFPDFAGLKLTHLLGGLEIPDDPSEFGWIKLRHGFDKARRNAWAEVAVDKRFDENPELFRLPPLVLSLLRPSFVAHSRIEVDAGGTTAQYTEATLRADWQVTLNGQPIMTIESATLAYDSRGGFAFHFQPSDLRLAPVLQFITDAMRSVFPSENGLAITPLVPGGVSVELNLPLPDIGTGAFTMTGITLHCHFDLLVAGGFEIRTGVWLSKPNRPFGMAILFLGGGGWFGVDVRYRPPQEFETRVSVGLAAGAFVAINFAGIARGSAGVLFTAGLDFYRSWQRGGSSDVAISIGMLVWGEFNILGIASAYLRVVLRIEYRNGSMTGYGEVSLAIKICWCFTLRVRKSVTLHFAGKQSKTAIPQAAARVVARAVAPPPVGAAVAAHFANLDW